MDLLSSLNKEQKEAVSYFEGPAIVLSGPGSGKTRVITHRIAHLIKHRGVAPQNVLAVTFTNKAANEMKERVTGLLGSRVPRNLGDQKTKQLSNQITLPTMGTFHSIGAKILRNDGYLLGLGKNFVIFDDHDSLSLVKEVMKELDIDPKQFSPSAIKNAIEGAKNELIGPQEYKGFAQGFFQEDVVSSVYDSYQKKLEEIPAADFEDLLRKTVVILQNHSNILKIYQNLWQFILVDEYQDTNKAQYVFSKILAEAGRNIFVVGDAAQAIYGWRGANFRNILNFSKDFPESKTFNLEQNYRSTKKILNAATSVISHNKSHPTLNLWTENAEGSTIIVYEAQNELEESGFVSRIISKLISSRSDFSHGSFAVLYRTNAQSRVIEEAFLREAIPYTIVGGVRFYERKEIKDILSYLRLVLNPKDNFSYKRVVNVPPRGIGAVALKTRGEKVEGFEDLLKILRAKSKNLATGQIIDLVLTETGYLKWLDDGSVEAAARIENVKELGSVAAEFPNLVDFLENISLVEREYTQERPSLEKTEKDVVTLMTTHAAKGLEFPVVFIIGMEEGLFPHSRSLIDQSELEEERRLCYVGITRAKEQLYLTYATNRLYFGQRNAGIPSRFIFDIPEDLVTTIHF